MNPLFIRDTEHLREELMRLLVCRNPRALRDWLDGLSLEQLADLRDRTYEELDKKYDPCRQLS